MKAFRFFSVFVCVHLWLFSPPARAEDGSLAGLDDYVLAALKKGDVPGVAIAVVKDDAVVLCKGYGLRKLGESNPVTEHTRFAIGSATKAFTAAALGVLVDEKRLGWDDPVVKHLPHFQMHDPYVTRQITVRDLLCHRSGLKRHEAMWYASVADRDTIVRRLRHVAPDWGFRSKFGYQNVMFLVAGQVVPGVTGTGWDEFVQERLFKPLGMTDSSTNTHALSAADDVATPHQKVEGKITAIPWRNIDNIGPAGSINSSAADMAKWVRMQLGGGKFDKARLLQAATVNEMHSPQMAVPLRDEQAALIPQTHLSAYGLGWFLHDYRGKKLVEHGGAIDGMTAQVALVPEEKLGIVVLANRTGTMLPTALMYRIIDSYVGPPQRDWATVLTGVEKLVTTVGGFTDVFGELGRARNTKPALALSRYAGHYHSNVYGDVEVAEENGKLIGRYGPAFVADLGHWQYETFRAVWRDKVIDKAYVTFVLDDRGRVEQLKVKGVEDDDLVFTRGSKPPGVPKGEELAKYAGTFATAFPPLEVKVERDGDRLKLSAAGQPTLTLVPVGGVRFRVEGAAGGGFVRFEAAGGKVRGLTLEPVGRPGVVLGVKASSP